MGFFSDVGNWVSNNVQSAVADVGHWGSQIINNPITQTVLPIAASALGIPPQLTSMALNVSSQGFNAMTGGQWDVQNPTGQPTAQPTATGSNDVVNQNFQAIQQALQSQAQTIANLQNQQQPSLSTNGINQNAQNQAVTQTKSQKIIAHLKDNWYFYTGGVVVLGLGFWYMNRKPKYNYRRR